MVFPIIYFLFMFFCCVYSGIMMSQITEAIGCGQYCDGMERKYLIMAKFCFASSLIVLIMSIIATPIIFRRMRGKDFYPKLYCSYDCKRCSKYCYTTCTFIFSIAAACIFFANFILIPCTIFIKYKDETTVLSAAYKGFLTIWILMLVFPIVLIAMICILVCLKLDE